MDATQPPCWCTHPATSLSLDRHRYHCVIQKLPVVCAQDTTHLEDYRIASPTTTPTSTNENLSFPTQQPQP
ncbi:uncharacterized protein ALTATR162_LOCUS1026 [Alternaria atra]|uniref:Uncharacterized protein n=1 Tax=Alternaria atra TaxID=119953 RepID=A0A8J2HV50_9PLEO|nr:uncharacterized protein ALTATR162_LOCUS1026 [Alternaria atra]CAG5141844.1 unnamed protein product [Alternaria atra]